MSNQRRGVGKLMNVYAIFLHISSLKPSVLVKLYQDEECKGVSSDAVSRLDEIAMIRFQSITAS